MVAMEALTEYAYRARLRDITEMSVLVEASASPKANELVKISSENLASVYRLDVIFFQSLKFEVVFQQFLKVNFIYRYRMFGDMLMLSVEEPGKLYYSSKFNMVLTGKICGISRIDHISIYS